jgi:peptidoglycan/LPS O-acetylase OafA/YrhL
MISPPPLPDRRNAFTFLRLVFALLVVFAHSYPLGGFGLDPLERMVGKGAPLGFVAVLGFFIVSGFLITQSATTQPLGRYFLNRAARIVPGFWVCLLLTVLVLAPAVYAIQFPGSYSYWEALTRGPYSSMEYLVRNSLFHVNQYRIGPLFRGTPAGPVVNGSLWSLGPEVMCYLYLALLAVCGALRVRAVAAGIFLALYGVHVAAHFDPQMIRGIAHFSGKGWVNLGSPLFRGLFVAFAAGMLCFQLRGRLRWDWRWFAVAAALLAAAVPLRAFDLVWPLTLPYAVLCLAFRLSFHGVEKWGDFSYGIYIYSFPMQQCLALADVQRHGFFVFATASLALSIVAGFLSWRFVEEPVLRRVRAWSKGRSKVAATAAPEPAI